MDLLNEVSKRFNSVARSVTEKSRENPELNRLNGELQSAQAALEALYARYGKACYALKAGRGQPQAEEDLAVRIRAALLHIDELSRRRSVLQAMKRCPSCGAIHEPQARFCSNCGKRLPEDALRPEPMPAGQYCLNCGAERSPQDACCPVCGADFEAPKPAAPQRPAAEPTARPEAEEPTQEEERTFD